MFYKKTEEGWLVGEEVWLHGGRLHLSAKNKIEVDGWQWHDTPPKEYIEWINNNNNNEDITRDK